MLDSDLSTLQESLANPSGWRPCQVTELNKARHLSLRVLVCPLWEALLTEASWRISWCWRDAAGFA